MFERRLKIFIFFWVVAVGLLINRLGYLQIIKGQEYFEAINKTPPPVKQWIDTIRGSILDCQDRILAMDEGSYELCLHYKLTRLYDERFWVYHRYQWEQGAGDRLPSEEDLTRQKQLADELLNDICQICEVEVESLHGPIKKINDMIFNLRTSRARRGYYNQNPDLDYKLKPNSVAIWQDLLEQVSDENLVLAKVFHRDADVAESNISHWAMTVSEDAAFLVEERIIGSATQAGWAQRPVSIRTGKKRWYPYHETGCHLIGQLMPAAAEIDSSTDPNEDLLGAYQRGDRRGEWGVEYIFERYLRGHRGWQQFNVDNNKIKNEFLSRLGSDVKLTIDIALHQRIEQIYQGNNDQGRRYQGAAVIIDVPTGEIRAMVSAPTFDLNTYYNYDQYELLNSGDDPQKRKSNRALREIYMPGSTIKPTILMLALASEVVTPTSQIECASGSAPLTPRSICYLYGHGMVDAKEAIKKSCNEYFMEVSRQMGAEQVNDWLRTAGFGERLLIWPEGITEQLAYGGFFEARGYLQRSQNNMRDLNYVSVGLRPLEGTILQMANSMATIARDGVLVQPYLTLSPKVNSERFRIIDPIHIETVKEGMWAVINQVEGTAFNAFATWSLGDDQVQLYGKTGSTDFSVFAGFAQDANGSNLALALVVEDPGGGGTIAAPIARRIWQACVDLGYLHRQ
ncbi:MAG: hypothetical protein GY869_01340 [Planctomycetes bacterium]|nr:hypothetical protein [Planctomycetota bacterium]